MFKNLQAEMSRKDVSIKDISKAINRSYDTTRQKLSGKYAFSVIEMWEIKNKLFPECELGYLFEMEGE